MIESAASDLEAGRIPDRAGAAESRALRKPGHDAWDISAASAEPSLRALLEQHGFAVQRMYQLNKIGTPGWWLYGKVLRRRHISKVMLKIFDKTVWFWRRVDRLLPWRRAVAGGGGDRKEVIV